MAFSIVNQVVFLVLCVHGASGENSCASAADDDTVCLMQKDAQLHQRVGDVEKAAPSNQAQAGLSCSDLNNQGAYFTVHVGIGTPEQDFNLVADTGSDALIVPDCRCVQWGYCDAGLHCFAGEKSQTFALDLQSGADHSVNVMGAKMNYGSGQVQVLAASEHVNLQGTLAHMSNGVFLMEDRRSLNVHGNFEGILGLGLPHHHPLTKKAIEIPSFMDSSDVTKYSLCFNAYPQPGALRAGMSQLANPMTNIGTVHWGLDLQGFSVGADVNPVVFCDPAQRSAGEQTSCGAIPDSGTTLLMGPVDHIHALFSTICDQWPRCSQLAVQNQATEPKAKARIFHNVLSECESWMTADTGISEVPSIFIHLAGTEGEKQTVELSAWAYIVETTQETYQTVTAKLFDEEEVASQPNPGMPGASDKKICTPSFGKQEYNTAKNGHVWIMGAPLFYATTVGYDLEGAGGKPQISLTNGPCTLCNDTASLLSESATETSHATSRAPHQRPLRHLSHILEKGINVNDPL